ncbi:MAG: diguanylate cyclase [Rhodocyclaceae bacterium]|nr:diguanylate cyclase [Rhodocyclaceae bacterium]
MKALVIEDTVTSAAVVCQQLGKLGFETQHASDGEKGIAAFKEDKPDLVLLDIIMPGIDGFEVARRIRQLERNAEWTPIIFLSARTSDADLEKGIEVGGDDYLVKPVSEAVLGAKIRAMQRISQMRYSLLVLTRKLDEANRELKRLSAVDGLTGIANRRSFDDALAKEWRRAARNQASLALLLIDVDHFKQFNDNYGHQLGDECLKAVARTLDAQLRRPGDNVARYGGEEFVVLLPQTDAAGAVQVGENLRVAIERLAITHRHSGSADVVTISIGVAAAKPPRDAGEPDGLVDAADRALYGAKRQGRNRVCSSGEITVGAHPARAAESEG